MAIAVGLKTAQVRQRQGNAALCRVERAVFQGKQALAGLAEVFVEAGLAQLVVALDGALAFVTSMPSIFASSSSMVSAFTQRPSNTAASMSSGQRTLIFRPAGVQSGSGSSR